MNREADRRIWQDTGRLLAMIREPGMKVAVITHVNPDGDAIGSSLGMAKLLTAMGHRCNVISPNDYPDFLKWMPGSREIVIFEKEPDRSAEMLARADLIISVDFNDLGRIRGLSEMMKDSKAYKLLIDHHPGPDDFADCILSDTAVSSSAELVWHFILSEDLRQYMDADVAACLFTGIMTDTGCFSHNCSLPATYQAVADLLAYGIDRDRIYSLVYDNFSGSRMKLLGYCLNEKMEILPEYHTALIWLTLEEQRKYHFQAGDSEGFVNLPLSIKGIRFTAFFIQKKDHIKMSFRSKGEFDVNAYAEKHFQGGGHRNASGGESRESMEKTIARFKLTLIDHMESLADDKH